MFKFATLKVLIATSLFVVLTAKPLSSSDGRLEKPEFVDIIFGNDVKDAHSVLYAENDNYSHQIKEVTSVVSVYPDEDVRNIWQENNKTFEFKITKIVIRILKFTKDATYKANIINGGIGFNNFALEIVGKKSVPISYSLDVYVVDDNTTAVKPALLPAFK